MKPTPNTTNELLVYVYNVVEDEWPFIASITDTIKRYRYIADAEDTSDAFFMSMAGEKEFVYISPKPLSESYQSYCKELMGYKSATVLVPQLRSHLICDDLVADAKSFSSLLSMARERKRVVLVSYAATEQLYSLKATLQKLGIEVFTPEAPKLESSWTVNFFGSKSGIRQLAQQSKVFEPDFVMPDGVISVGRDDTATIAANRYLKNKGVVIKTNKGSGGSGVLIFRENELPNTYKECKKEILKQMADDRYWDLFPVIIEDLININYGMAGGFPNVEYKIHKNGRIEMLYVCTCQVTPKGRYFGVDINEDILNDRIQTRLEDTGYFIAEKLSSAGYRGHFDIDMIAAKNGEIYVCESNTRNTGGTDTYKIARKLLGKDFMDDGYTLSRSRPNWFKEKTLTFETLIDQIDNLKYNPNKKEGLIINSENSIPDGKLIYTIIAKNKKRAYTIEAEMIKQLSSLDSLTSEFGTNL